MLATSQRYLEEYQIRSDVVLDDRPWSSCGFPLLRRRAVTPALRSGVSRSEKQQRRRKLAQREARRAAERRRKRLLVAGGAAAIVAALVATLVVFQPGPGPSGVTALESWDLPELDGDGRVALQDFAGRPTVAAFFASWCPHCQRELPGFFALSEQLGNQVNWVAINTQDSGRGSRLAQQSGIAAWPLARDVGGSDGRGLSANFGARGMPLTVIYGPDGRVVDVNLGVIDAAQLAAKLEAFFGVAAN